MEEKVMKIELGLVKDEQKMVGQEIPSIGKDMEKKNTGLKPELFIDQNIGKMKGNIWK